MSILLKEKRKKKFGLFTKIFSILYLLSVLGILALIIVSIVNSINNNSPSAIDDPSSTFALILAGITITLTSSIIIPKVLLKGEVQEEVEKFNDDIYKQLKEEYLPLLDTHVNVTDAHLSRMIGYLLLENSKNKRENTKEYLYQLIWSIGWALRSYKNYIRGAAGVDVMGEKVSIENYRDLIKINNDTSDTAKKLLFDEIDNCTDISEVGRIFFSSDSNPQEQEEYSSLFYRTIKETIEIDYQANCLWFKQKNKKKLVLSKSSKVLLDEWLAIISPVTTLLIAISFNHLSATKNLTERQLRRQFMDDVIRRSSYDRDDEFERQLENGLNYIITNFNKTSFSMDDLMKVKCVLRINK